MRGVARGAVLVVVAACSKPAAHEKIHEKTGAAESALSLFAAPSALVATPTDTGDVHLHWENHATAPGGSFVEFRTGPDEGFTLLDAVWANAAAFVHPDVAPATTFVYRVRPFFGAPSREATITAGAEDAGRVPESAPGAPEEEEGPLPDAPQAVLDARSPKPLRHALAMAEAAPGDFSAELSTGHPTNVILRWRDRASDEDGYLVEMAPAGVSVFQICALLSPNATSFRKVKLPPHTRMQFRARAYFSGTPSNLASLTTAPAL